MVAPEGIIAAEIAAKYGCSLVTVRRWMTTDEWPAPIGKRGRWLEFDAAEVEGYVAREAGDGDPNELLTPAQIAQHTKLAPGTVRSDISRGRFGEPDEDKAGVKRWKRSTIDEKLAGRRRYRRGE